MTSLNDSNNNSFISMYGEVHINAVKNTTKNHDNVEWGPVRDPLYIVVPVTVIYGIIFFTGVIGNVSTCIVIFKNRSMHTATNYYLFSLAVSDLVLLVSGLPPEMYYIWSKYPYVFGEVFCVLQGFAAETSANATVLTITAFTVERYVAICHPFMRHTMSNLSRAVKFVFAIWLLAMCLAVPQAMAFGLVYQTQFGDLDTWDSLRDDGVAVCVVKRQIVPHAFELSTLLFFITPMSVITVLYVLIAAQLRKSRIITRGEKNQKIKHRPQSQKPSIVSKGDIALEEMRSVLENSVVGTNYDQNNYELPTENVENARKNSPRNAHLRSTRHVLKILIAVVVAFFICWAPFHAQRLLAVYSPAELTPSLLLLYSSLTYVSGVLYYLSTTINPLLYNIMSRKFRIAFKETLSSCLLRNNEQKTEGLIRRYSNLSIQNSNCHSHNQSQCYSYCHHSRYSSHRRYDPDFSKRPMVVTFRKIPNNSNYGSSSYNNSQSDEMTSGTANRLNNSSPLCELELESFQTGDAKIEDKTWNWVKTLNIFKSKDKKMAIIAKPVMNLKLNGWNPEICKTEENIITRLISEPLVDNNNTNFIINTEIKNDEMVDENELVPMHRCPKNHTNKQNKDTSENLRSIPHSKTLPNITMRFNQSNDFSKNNFSKSYLNVLDSCDV